MTKSRQRNEQMLLEMRNYLIKILFLNLNCFKISFRSTQGGFSEKILCKNRMQIKDNIALNFENLEFIFIVNAPGKKIETNMIVCFRPIFSNSLNENSLYSNLNEHYMLYDDIKISSIKNVFDIDKAISNMFNELKYPTHSIINFSRFFENQQASLTDFLIGNFGSDESQAIVEINRFSNIKGNLSSSFDENSLYYLIKLFLNVESNNYDFSRVDILEFLRDFDLKSVEMIKFFETNFTYQTSLIDIAYIISKHRKTLFNILKDRKDEHSKN